MLRSPRSARTLGAACALSALLAASAALAGCATVHCEDAGKDKGLDPKQAEQARAQCEQQIADMKQRVKQDEEDRQIRERRAAFVERSGGQRRP